MSKRVIEPTMTKKKSVRINHNLSTSQKVGIGVGLTATALAAVGGYFFYGSKDAAKNRKKAKSWMLKAKAEVLEGLEGAKHMTKEEYDDLVTKVVKGYKTAKKASAGELVEFAKNMHAHWRDIERAGEKRIRGASQDRARYLGNEVNKKYPHGVQHRYGEKRIRGASHEKTATAARQTARRASKAAQKKRVKAR